jgi:hypothetical protein
VFSPLIHVSVLGQFDDLNEFSAGTLASYAGGDVVGVTRDPQGIQAVASREREKQAAGSCCVSVSSICWLDPVANMAGIGHDVVGVANPQVDATDMLMAINQPHFEFVDRYKLLAWVAGVLYYQNELKLIVDQIARVVKLEHLF